MWKTFWTTIDSFLTSSAPSDGWIYDAKTWVLSNVTEPILEVAYCYGIRSYKPIMAYQPEDLL